MSNPYSDATIIFEPQAIGNFIRCFDDSGLMYWLAFINVERVFTQGEDIFVATAAGAPLIVARLRTTDAANKALFTILQSISSSDQEKEDEA